MERRFKFKSSSRNELFLYAWGKPLLGLALAVCIILNPFARLDLPEKLLVAIVTFLVAALLFWRVGDIERRDEQARHGFVELAATELCLGLSAHSVLRVPWPNFDGSVQRNGWLYLQFHDAEINRADSPRRLDRVRLRELEAPESLMEALRAHTPPQTNH